VNKALLSLAVAGLALSAAQASFAQASKAPVVQSDVFNLIPINRIPKSGFIPLQEAFRLQGTINSTATQTCPGAVGVARNVAFCGGGAQETTAHFPTSLFGGNVDNSCVGALLNGTNQSGPELVTAVPGIFALCSVNKNFLSGSSSVDLRQRINCNAFATCTIPAAGGFPAPPAGSFGSPFVQSCRLIKNIPMQPKCPGVFPGASFIQFGTGIRTWWALKFTPPGTTFTLEVTTRCLGQAGTRFFGQTSIHIDRLVFQVCVTPESLLALIDVFHAEAIGTSEIPCIAAEDVFLSLRLAIARITCQTTQQLQQDKLFEAEALVVAFCAFGDCFVAEDFFGTFPPSNDIDLGGAFGPTGILDTIENPCCCKLLVDLDNLGNAFGILTSTTGDP
jgi:hypothetical protein